MSAAALVGRVLLLVVVGYGLWRVTTAVERWAERRVEHTDEEPPDPIEVLDETVRFAEEHGYNRWQEARDTVSSIRSLVEAAVYLDLVFGFDEVLSLGQQHAIERIVAALQPFTETEKDRE